MVVVVLMVVLSVKASITNYFATRPVVLLLLSSVTTAASPVKRSIGVLVHIAQHIGNSSGSRVNVWALLSGSKFIIGIFVE